jgi:predicted nucleic acid-binding protein
VTLLDANLLIYAYDSLATQPAAEHGTPLCTNDRDFLRFPGLKVEFPLQ